MEDVESACNACLISLWPSMRSGLVVVVDGGGPVDVAYGFVSLHCFQETLIFRHGELVGMTSSLALSFCRLCRGGFSRLLLGSCLLLLVVAAARFIVVVDGLFTWTRYTSRRTSTAVHSF